VYTTDTVQHWSWIKFELHITMLAFVLVAVEVVFSASAADPHLTVINSLGPVLKGEVVASFAPNFAPASGNVSFIKLCDGDGSGNCASVLPMRQATGIVGDLFFFSVFVASWCCSLHGKTAILAWFL
jgi:hypothetical protein